MTKDVLENAKTGNPAWDTIIDLINSVGDKCGELVESEEGCDLNILLIAENPKLGIIDYFRSEDDDPNKLIGMLVNHKVMGDAMRKEIRENPDIKDEKVKKSFDSDLLTNYLLYGVLNFILFDEKLRNTFFKRVREKQLIKGDWTVATQEEVNEYNRDTDNAGKEGGKEE